MGWLSVRLKTIKYKINKRLTAALQSTFQCSSVLPKTPIFRYVSREMGADSVYTHSIFIATAMAADIIIVRASIL